MDGKREIWAVIGMCHTKMKESDGGKLLLLLHQNWRRRRLWAYRNHLWEKMLWQAERKKTHLSVCSWLPVPCSSVTGVFVSVGCMHVCGRTCPHACACERHGAVPKGPELALMLCSHQLEILNPFWLKGPVFSFCARFPKLHTWS